MNHISSCVRVRRLFKVEKLLPPCTRTGDVAILLWRTLSWVARPLALIEETVKVVDYRSINVDLLHSYIASVFQLEVRS
ncbi:hypothetical protein TNCV_4412821 [Trichonephila clavipes]|nr:hypothetical protein TNCV_4412821 [Trichonephila clavipes]